MARWRHLHWSLKAVIIYCVFYVVGALCYGMAQASVAQLGLIEGLICFVAIVLAVLAVAITVALPRWRARQALRREERFKAWLEKPLAPPSPQIDWVLWERNVEKRLRPQHCPHPRLQYDPKGHQGIWICRNCGATIPDPENYGTE